MDRFFATLSDDEAKLSSESVHHLLDVLRHKEGDEIEIVIGNDAYKAVIKKTSPFSLELKEKLIEEKALKAHLTLAFALLKGGHDELVIQKGTELGVTSFLPFISSRTIIRLDEKDKIKRLERFKKIALSSSEQSKRLDVPEVLPIASLKGVAEREENKKFLAYEGVSSSGISLPKAFSSVNPGESALIAIGPEGGFSLEEVDMLIEKGFQCVSLGKRILRAETSSFYAASVFSSIFES